MSNTPPELMFKFRKRLKRNDRHQIKALSMMREKEAGRLENNEFGSLWQAITSNDGHKKYKTLSAKFR
jgi:Mg/Co/Ni transporter MgtE